MRPALAAILALSALTLSATPAVAFDRNDDAIIPQLRPAAAGFTTQTGPDTSPVPRLRPTTTTAIARQVTTPSHPSVTTAVAMAQPKRKPVPSAAPADPRLTVLSTADVFRYRQIFTDERNGNFKHADMLTDQLQDKSLIGYIKAEYLLSPHSGHMSSHKLISWMRSYRDLPIAERVRKLAKRRAGHHHHVPYVAQANYRGGGYEDYDPTEKPIRSRTGAIALRHIRSAIRVDKPERADTYLQELIARNSLSREDIAVLARQVSRSYLIENNPKAALALAEAAAADGGRDAAPRLDWCAGLAAYQLGRFDVAAGHFKTLAKNSGLPDTMAAAAWFWAARSYLRAGTPEPVAGLLQKAAAKEPTFYGLLAESLLGQDPHAKFHDPNPKPEVLKAALRAPATRRAVALWQINPQAYASYISEELNRGFGNAKGKDLDEAYAWLARQIGAPNIEMRASETTAKNDHVLLTGLFPVPAYEPNGGYTIDSALVLAFARIESRFQPKAESPAGAVGLMQLMPATARLIAGRSASHHALRNPAYNLSLGQRYIARMLDFCNGNLIKMAAAYNAGPGKVQQWSAAFTGDNSDALLFLETMHAPETRSYVKKLLTYYWMYHRTDGKSDPSLTEAARGAWPEYHPPKQTAPAAPPPDTDEDNDDDDIPVS